MEDVEASSPTDPAAHGGPDLRDLTSTDTGVSEEDAETTDADTDEDEEATHSRADGGTDAAR